MGRLEREIEEKIKIFIADLIKNKNEDCFSKNGEPSPIKIVKLIEEKLNLKISRQAVHNIIKKSRYVKYMKDIDLTRNKDIVEIQEMINSAHEIVKDAKSSPADKTKALGVWKHLKQQYLDHIQKLKDLELRAVEAKKPIYLIRFNPSNAERICPKCGNKFYELKSEVNEKDKKNDGKVEISNSNQ